jgi:hypothetical protein
MKIIRKLRGNPRAGEISVPQPGAFIRQSIAFAAIALAGFATNPASAANIVANDGFETPDEYILWGSAFNAYDTPSGTSASWSFQGSSGIAANGSAFNVSNAPNGNSDGTTSTLGQAGFIQQGDGTITDGGSASISQVLTLNAGTYDFSVQTEGRPSGFNPLTAILYNAALTTDYLDLNFTPTSSTSFNAVTSSFTVPTTGQYDLYFVGDGNDGNDVTSFIDNAEVTAVPEPASMSLVVAGAIILIPLMRSRRKTA